MTIQLANMCSANGMSVTSLMNDILTTRFSAPKPQLSLEVPPIVILEFLSLDDEAVSIITFQFMDCSRFDSIFNVCHICNPI